MEKFIKIVLALGIIFNVNLIYCQTFEITTDTINISIKNIMSPANRISLTHAVKYNDKYYCIFSERNIYHSWKNNKYFFIILPDGTIEHRIELPDKIKNSSYCDLFIKDDCIFLKEYYDHWTFYLDTKKMKWIRTKEVDDVIYEDDKYNITYLDYGEWGYRTWFKDKRTKLEYELASDGKIVNKIDSLFYITSIDKILKIDNPLKLNPCEPKYYYNKAQTSRIRMSSNSLIGAEVIYNDSTQSYFFFDESEPYIITSFTYNNQLFHLFNDINATYITKLENNKMTPLQTLDERYKLFTHDYSYRMKIQKDNSQLLTISTKDENVYGFIEIQDNKIHIRYLQHDIDSLEYIGHETFPTAFDFIYGNIGSLTLQSVDSLEQTIGGIGMNRITQRRLYSSNNQSSLISGKNYIKTENSYITNISVYYFTGKDSLIKNVSMDWLDTKSYNNQDSYDLGVNKKGRIPIFQAKLEEIENYINLKTGSVATKEIRTNDIKKIWKTTDGITISLYYSNNFEGMRPISLNIDKE